MSKLIWVLKYFIVPVLVLLIAAAVIYYNDWGGIRSAQVTNSIKEVETAIELGRNYCEVPQFYKPVFRNWLGQASEHKWKAIQARDRKDFGEAYLEIARAREYIDQAREFCPVMSVPRKEPLWEKLS